MAELVLNTDGNGLWSSVAKPVPVTKIDFIYNGGKYAELQVFFDTSVWDVEKDGLIYTDPKWLEELKAYLKQVGYSEKEVNSVDYTEQGMQGKDYVSLDVSVSLLLSSTESENKDK